MHTSPLPDSWSTSLTMHTDAWSGMADRSWAIAPRPQWRIHRYGHVPPGPTWRAPDYDCRHLGGCGQPDTAASEACGSATNSIKHTAARSVCPLFIACFLLRVSRAPMQQVGPCRDGLDVAEVVDDLQTFLTFPTRDFSEHSCRFPADIP